ncbi:hypothetical protein HBH56_026490 [Parastagonospora nodorum]|nr:hypothetical protein HBH56_026490 [Parastagonospora nodorum]KAH3934188.1 hypothetical protein HBH54_055550 [Parastagonospora nodorum]KAH3949631.1 hypothetical protein HBH53_083240 [Parastagonospora nodorum]KAH3975971.1 hypothetical protein HBH51_082140 [Parastagonospora nodorum]KAH3984844.1 hypothetical protein HBH52_054360 [Parastagonospora nodorum]
MFGRRTFEVSVVLSHPSGELLVGYAYVGVWYLRGLHLLFLCRFSSLHSNKLRTKVESLANLRYESEI